MKIVDILTCEGMGGFFYDDQAAVKTGATRNGEYYDGAPVTVGFSAIRMPARSLGVGLVMDDGKVVWGDAISVQYPGIAGRDVPFEPHRYVQPMLEEWFPRFAYREASTFRENAHVACSLLQELEISHVALEYGITQALLAAAAHARGITMAEVVCEEWSLPLVAESIPLFAQSGELRHKNVDKMILKRVETLPHGLVNSPRAFGSDGESFLDYVRWVVERVLRLGGKDYHPTLHFDIYGMAGQTFGISIERIVQFLREAKKAAMPLRLRIESPIIMESQTAQVEVFGELRHLLSKSDIGVEIVADEWCNTLRDAEVFIAAGACDLVQIKVPDLGSLENAIRAVLACREAGVGAYLGGSCTETDLSAQASTHIGIATRPEVMLAKPGMGVDEGISVVRNTQARTIAEMSARSIR